MATTTFKTRLKNMVGTYAEWTAKNPVLLAGEFAVVEIPSSTGAVPNEPAYMLKVGDGVQDFNTLPFVNAIAADVYSWAKEAEKPVYTASEIEGLADYISGEIQDTNTQYKIEQDAENAHILRMYSKEVNGDWTLVTTITTVDTVYDDTALAGRVTSAEGKITALEDKVGATPVADQIDNKIAALDLANTYDAKGAAAQALADAKTHVEGVIAGLDVEDVAVAGKYVSAVSEVDGKVVVSRENLPDYSATYAPISVVEELATEKERAEAAEKANADAITVIKDGAAIDSFKDVEDALAGKQAVGDYATKAEAQAMADGKDASIKEAKDAADAAQADVDALEAKVGEVPEGKTVVGMIAEAQEAATYDDTQVKADIKTIADDYLKAADKTELEGKIKTNADAIAAEKARMDAFMEASEVGEAAVDTLKEIQTYIDTHGAAADQMVKDIAANKAAVEAEVARAEGAEEALSGRLDTLEAIDHEAYKGYADQAEADAVASAKAYADELKTAIDTEVAKKANDADLAAIAKTGNVADLIQSEGDVIIFDCGSVADL